MSLGNVPNAKFLTTLSSLLQHQIFFIDLGLSNQLLLSILFHSSLVLLKKCSTLWRFQWHRVIKRDSRFRSFLARCCISHRLHPIFMFQYIRKRITSNLQCMGNLSDLNCLRFTCFNIFRKICSLYSCLENDKHHWHGFLYSYATVTPSHKYVP